MSEQRAYVRVYWTIVDDPKFAEVYDDDRALSCWLRHMSGTRMFGRWATSANAAVEALIAKVEPMTRSAVEGARS